MSASPQLKALRNPLPGAAWNEVSHGLIILLTLPLLLISCTPSYLTKEDLTKYLQDPSNGLVQVKEQGSLKMSVTYRPTDLLVDQELDDYSNEDEVGRLQKKYTPYAYFILSLEAAGRDALYSGSSDQGAFSENLQTLSFRMGQYVNMTTSAQDTIPVADYIFPRTFGMGGSTNLMFVFNREKMQEAEWVSFNLSEFGLRSGDQRFRFKLTDIEKIPRLKELKQN